MPKKKRPPKDPQPVTYDDLPEAERKELREKMAELERERKAPDAEKGDIPF
jgi:hypothetical protein